MARDLDFRPRPKPPIAATPPTRPAPLPTNSQPPPPGRPPAPPTRPGPNTTPNRWAWWALALVIIGLGLLGVALYAQTTKPLPTLVINTPTAETTALATAGSTSTSSPTATATNSQPTIQVYDGGSGESVASSIIKTIKSAGYTTESLGKSQFDYDKTFLYYRSAFATQAEAVAKLLAGRDVTLKESKIEGSFDILIYLGKR